MFNDVLTKFSGMQNDLLCLNDLLRQQEGNTVLSSFIEKTKRLLSPSYDQSRIQAIADRILIDLEAPEKKESSLLLADAFVRCYEKSWNGSKISQIFDRTVSSYRPQNQFVHEANLAKFIKWQRNGQDPLIYHHYPDFCNFMETSGLLSQIKVTRDVFQVIDGEPAIKVNSEWMKWSVFKTQFKSVYSERYRETFVTHIDHQVFTYLDNGKGLQPHHPYLSESTPTSLLSNEDYAKVLEKAHLFVREGEENLSPEQLGELNKNRTFVLQLVTSSKKGADTRFNNMIVKPQHPYVRLIVGEDKPCLNVSKGEVYEVGYGRKGPRPTATPLITTEGRFRSPDINEYLPFAEKIVTNIPVTPEEAQSFASYVSDYHRYEVNIGNPLGFHLLGHNCSTFVRAALKSANIKVPTKNTLAELLPKITPLSVLKANEQVKNLASRVFSVIKNPFNFLPSMITTPLQKLAKKVSEKFHDLLEMLTAVIFIPLKIALGEAFGTGGRAFVKNGDQPSYIEPSFKRWFMLSDYSVNLPGILQKWQRDQASTVVYKNPIKLCIVP